MSVENEGSREEAGVEAIFTPPMHNTSPHLSSHHPATPATVDSTLEPILEVPQQPAGIFEEFMYHVGPPMVSPTSPSLNSEKKIDILEFRNP